MKDTSILPVVLNKKSYPHMNFDESSGVIKGQLYISNNDVYINKNNIKSKSHWYSTNLNNTSINFKTGISFFLGNNIPKVIYHDLHRLPTFINITILEFYNSDELGEVYVDFKSDLAFNVINSGYFCGKFCWFII